MRCWFSRDEIMRKSAELAHRLYDQCGLSIKPNQSPFYE